jgi:hypothetical protein
MRICKLSLCLFNDVLAANFFISLALNPHVEDLEISLQHISSREGCDAVEFLIEHTTSIESVNIYSSDARCHCPITHGLKQATSVIDITFEGCSFEGQAALLFKSFLQTKPCICSLCMRLCEFGDDEISAETFIERLGQRAELRNLEVTGLDYSMRFLQNLLALLLAVEKSQLDSFAIGTIYDDVQFQYLIQSIPKMKVRLLRFYVVDRDDEYGQPYLERFKSPMMAALKQQS